MCALHKKIIAVLLSLLLGLLPLQGVFATDSSMMHFQDAMVDANVGVDMNHEQLSDMVLECDQGEQDSCCSGSSCDVHHCASCVFAAVPTVSSLLLSLPFASHLAIFESRITSFTPASLYRPPRA